MTQVTRGKTNNYFSPEWTPDGRYVYFTEDVSPGGGFQYNRDAHGQVYVIQRFDRQTGNRATAIGGAGSALRPQLSPDGKTMAYIRRVGLKSVLFVRDLESGRERLERASAELAPDGAAGERDDPLGSLLRLEQQAQVHRALWTLPERQRTCLLLRHAGYSYAEIADTCELAVGSVGVLLARAERTFRDSYQRQQQGADHEVP